VVEPRRGGEPIPDPKPDLSAHPPTTPVPLLGGQGDRVLRRVDVAGLGEDTPALTRQVVEPAQQSLRLCAAGEEAEIVPEQHDRVETAERLVHVLYRADPRVPDAAPPADLHGAGRDVDRDYVVATRLQVQRHA